MLPDGAAGRIDAARREVTVGLRPESFIVDPGDGRDGHDTVRGLVEVVEQLGSESLVYFRAEHLEVLEFGDRPVELRGALCARLPASVEYEPGDRIDLRVQGRLVRLFDRDGGRAVLSP